MQNKKLLTLMAILATIVLFGCTRYDPYTGQNQVDYGATAGVAGLALGAAALGVAASNRNDPNVVVVRPGYRPYGGFRPAYRPPAFRPPAYRPYGSGYRQGYRHGYRHGRRY